MKKLLIKFKAWIKEMLGIRAIERKAFGLERSVNELRREREWFRREALGYKREFEELKAHVEMLNQNFFVAADISPKGYDPTVITVMMKGKTPVVKNFDLSGADVQTVNKFLENFSQQHTKIDAPHFYPNPHFKFK